MGEVLKPVGDGHTIAMFNKPNKSGGMFKI
jgi:hypothetical protein